MYRNCFCQTEGLSMGSVYHSAPARTTNRPQTVLPRGGIPIGSVGPVPPILTAEFSPPRRGVAAPVDVGPDWTDTSTG